MVIDLREANTFVAVSRGSQRGSLAADSRVRGVATDHVESVALPERNMPTFAFHVAIFASAAARRAALSAGSLPSA